MVKMEENIVDLHDGLFEVILVKYPRSIIETGRIISGVLASDFSDDMFDFFKAKEVTFELEEETSWSLDGEEVAGPKSVTIRNLHSAIEMYL